MTWLMSPQESSGSSNAVRTVGPKVQPSLARSGFIQSWRDWVATDRLEPIAVSQAAFAAVRACATPISTCGGVARIAMSKSVPATSGFAGPTATSQVLDSKSTPAASIRAPSTNWLQFGVFGQQSRFSTRTNGRYGAPPTVAAWVRMSIVAIVPSSAGVTWVARLKK